MSETTNQAAQSAAETFVIGHSKTIAGAGVAVAVGSRFTLNDIAIVIGIFVALLGVAVPWYYHHKRDRREEREYAARRKREEAEHERRMNEMDAINVTVRGGDGI